MNGGMDGIRAAAGRNLDLAHAHRPPGTLQPGPATGVIPRLDLRGRHLTLRELRAALPRAEFDVEAALASVRPIVEAVREQGAVALYAAAERFDGVAPPRLRVPAEVIAAALDALDPPVRAALEESDPPGPPRARRPAPHRHHDARSPRAAPSPSGGCRSTGSASTCPAAWRSTRAASS